MQMIQEQTQQIRAQFREIIQTLFREQIALQGLEDLHQAMEAETAKDSREMGKPITSVKEFAINLVNLIDGRLASYF